MLLPRNQHESERSLSRCDYSEVEDKGYHLVTLNTPDLRPDLSDLDIWRRSLLRAAEMLRCMPLDHGATRL
jgi:hypothetical protein